jgi:general stress protein CsbA
MTPVEIIIEIAAFSLLTGLLVVSIRELRKNRDD